MSEDDAIIAVVGLLFAMDSNRKRKSRSVWCKEWLKKRTKFSHVNLLNELRFAPKDWHNYLRMNEQTYFILLEKVTPLIQKKDTVLRPSISAHERLTATLRYLASGRSYADMKFSTIISPQALSNIIPETCRAIYKVLHKEFLKVGGNLNK